jgi:hypothetical protein
MRIATVLLLAAASGALCRPHDDPKSAHLDKRQRSFGNLGEALGFVAKPAKKERIDAIIRQGAIRERLWFGPFTLPALNASKALSMPALGFNKMDPNSVQLNKGMTGFCTNCTVLSGKAALNYADGTKAGVTSGVYIHHVVIVDPSKQTMPLYLCVGQKGFLGTVPVTGFIIAGNDEADNFFTTPDGKFNSGYFIGAKPQMALQAELINYKNIEQKVYITAEYEYVPGINADSSDSSVSLFSVNGCNNPDYHVSKDKPQYNMTSANVPIPKDGFIINAKGHLHDGGTNIILKLNGQEVCNSKAKYDLDPRASESLAPNGMQWQVITEMTQCTTPTPVKKGDILQVVSLYDNKLHPPRMAADGMHGDSDQMGVFFINFATKSKKTQRKG